MTPDIALQQLRNLADRLHASGCHWRSERITEAADAIEAAMREPVGEAGYAWSSASTSQATHYGVPFVALGEMNVPPGTKLFTFPPSAQAELVRITEQLAERDAEIKRLKALWYADVDPIETECAEDYRSRAALAGKEGK